MKTTVTIIGVVLVGLAICWVTGMVDFTYQNVVPNEPLLHPKKVIKLEGTNMILEDGNVLALSPRYSSERSIQEVYQDISFQVVRSSFYVDLETNANNRVEIFVRHHRKFRDSVPPFTIPIIRETVGREYRMPLAYGTYLDTSGDNPR